MLMFEEAVHKKISLIVGASVLSSDVVSWSMFILFGQICDVGVFFSQKQLALETSR